MWHGLHYWSWHWTLFWFWWHKKQADSKGCAALTKWHFHRSNRTPRQKRKPTTYKLHDPWNYNCYHHSTHTVKKKLAGLCVLIVLGAFFAWLHGRVSSKSYFLQIRPRLRKESAPKKKQRIPKASFLSERCWLFRFCSDLALNLQENAILT